VGRHVVYDVAVSVDGYIDAGAGNVKAFAFGGEHVSDYLQRVKGYETVIMGRATYEAGYAWGLQPGDKPYTEMHNLVFSRSLELPKGSLVEVIREDAAVCVRAMKGGLGGDIYLCGGGAFAGAMLKAGLIDRVILKMNPIALGGGTPLFGREGKARANLRLENAQRYESGVMLLEYAVD
jgi:dihydrofolate reductase